MASGLVSPAGLGGNTTGLSFNEVGTNAKRLELLREFVDVGGLMAYGPDQREMYRRAAVLVNRILQGAKPASLPVEQPRKFGLIVNLMTAKTLGLTIPRSLLLLADELIQ